MTGVCIGCKSRELDDRLYGRNKRKQGWCGECLYKLWRASQEELVALMDKRASWPPKHYAKKKTKS